MPALKQLLMLTYALFLFRDLKNLRRLWVRLLSYRVDPWERVLEMLLHNSA